MIGTRPLPHIQPLRPADLARTASVGLRTRPLRAGLSALGIAIGIAAMVAVLGLAASSQAGLVSEINRLGPNLLTVSNGQNLLGQPAELPSIAPAMISRIRAVTGVAATGSVSASVYRTTLIPAVNTNGLSVDAATTGLLPVVGSSIAQGRFLNAGTARLPVAVLGADAARRLGIDRVLPGERIWLGGQWFSVAGIIRPAVLATEIDSAVLVGFPAAATYLGFDRHPTTIYIRAQTSQVSAVQALLGTTADPQAPYDVKVSRPSDALVAEADAKNALNGLFLGLGAVALLVGGVGIANIMIISVLERRSEIGLRRSLGATKGQIRGQFFAEALILSLLGGAAGVILGTAATAIYATTKTWAIVVPPVAVAGGLGAALAVGAIAGLLPAIRAAKLSPTEALRTT